jgi:hypothetical protein
MTHPEQTEASCLLQTGALYRSRVGLYPAGRPNELIFAGFKKGAFSIYFGDAPIYHFDLEGRWQRAYLEPTHFLKGLNSTVHAIDRVREGANLVLKRRHLTHHEVEGLDRQVRGVALGLISELDAGRLARLEPPMDKAQPLESDPLRDFLARIASWDRSAWDAHLSQFQAAYHALPFLPPDSQNAVVLQATRGQARGLCFGRNRSSGHAVRSPGEFKNHTQAVSTLLGRRLDQMRVAFLAGSDVLHLPREAVCSYLEILDEVFRIVPKAPGQSTLSAEDGPRLEGVHTFLDDFDEPLPGLETLRAYRQRNLAHVSLGFESGDADVRTRYGRSWKEESLRALVADLRSAEIAVSVLTLVGAGGAEGRERHLWATARLLTTLDLPRGCTVFLLDAREIEAPEALMTDETMAERAEEQEHLKEALGPLRSRGVKVLPYSLDKQWV